MSTDQVLIDRFLAGDRQAFDELMRRHEDRIFGLALRVLGDRDDALEAVQETFLTVFRKVRQFSGRSAFSTWLYRVAMNTCYDALRKAKRRRTVPANELTDPPDLGAQDAHSTGYPPISGRRWCSSTSRIAPSKTRQQSSGCQSAR